MKRVLIFETTLEQIYGGLFLQLAVALREHYISPESFVWSPKSDGTAVTVCMTVRPHDARWLPDVAEQLHRLSGVRDMQVCNDGDLNSRSRYGLSKIVRALENSLSQNAATVPVP